MTAQEQRELLEWAAKAAGLDRPVLAMGCGIVYAGGKYWNPLIDDGDALRLAVKLSLLDEHPGFRYALAVEMGANPDPYTATRLAITRAAAEIGKGMA